MSTLLKKLKLSFLFKKEEIFCQGCGKNLTNEGGIISASSKVYCLGIGLDGKECASEEIRLTKGRLFGSSFRYYTANELQRAVKKKEIEHYSKPNKKNI